MSSLNAVALVELDDMGKREQIGSARGIEAVFDLEDIIAAMIREAVPHNAEIVRR